MWVCLASRATRRARARARRHCASCASETSLCQLREREADVTSHSFLTRQLLATLPSRPCHAFVPDFLSPLVLVLSPPLDAYLSPARDVTFSLYQVGVLGPGDQEAELPAAGGSPVARVVALVSVLGVRSVGITKSEALLGFPGPFRGERMSGR